MPENDIPPCLIYIDKEGRWFHKGAEIIRREFIRFFYQHMEIDSQGECVINWLGDRCYVEVEDTPVVVWRASLRDSDQGEYPCFILYLSDDSQEELSPDTLYVGDENVLYCRVKDRVFPARFGRNAYYQLAEYIEEEDGRYYLPFKGERYLVSEGNN